MVEVKRGMMIPLSEAKHGKSERGEWMLVPLKADKGSDRITIWAVNPQDAKRLERCARVDHIVSAKLGARKGSDDKWYPEYSVNAVLVQGDSEEQLAFEDIMREVNDDDLPFA